jgi:transcriptional regulator of acetoin/glycerol metabolism
VIEADDLRFEGPGVVVATAGSAGAGPGAPLTLEELERQHITRVLEGVGGRVSEASQRLGIPRSTLYQKIKKYGIA